MPREPARRFYSASDSFLWQTVSPQYSTQEGNLIPIFGQQFSNRCLHGLAHGTFPTTSRASPTPTAAVFGHRHPRSWWFDIHGCPPSAIEHFRWLIAASGTVCRLTLPQLQRWLFFGIASKLSFSPNHFLINCFPFLVLYAAYCSGLAVLYLGHSK